MTDADLLRLTRIANLRGGDVLRSKRAVDKRQIASGELDPARVLRDLPRHWESAKLVDLVQCVRGVGPTKAGKWCGYIAVTPTRRLVDMSPRQRWQMAAFLDLKASRPVAA